MRRFEQISRVVIRAFFGLALASVSAARASAADTVLISGRVYDKVEGNALAGTPVDIVDSAGSVRHLVTDSHGRYRAIGLASGIVTTVVSRQGFDEGRQDCTVSPGDSLQLDFGLITGMHMMWTQHFRCTIEPDTVDRYVVQ